VLNSTVPFTESRTGDVYTSPSGMLFTPAALSFGCPYREGHVGPGLVTRTDRCETSAPPTDPWPCPCGVVQAQTSRQKSSKASVDIPPPAPRPESGTEQHPFLSGRDSSEVRRQDAKPPWLRRNISDSEAFRRHYEESGVDVPVRCNSQETQGPSALAWLPVAGRPQRSIRVVDERTTLVGKPLPPARSEARPNRSPFQQHLLTRVHLSGVIEQIAGQNVQPRVSHLSSFLRAVLYPPRRKCTTAGACTIQARGAFAGGESAVIEGFRS